MYRTSGAAEDDGQREGVRIYEVEVPRDQVEPHTTEDGRLLKRFMRAGHMTLNLAQVQDPRQA